MVNQSLIPASVEKDLPSMVKTQLKKMSATKQEEFVEEFRRRQKNTGVAYAFWFFFGVHYGYLKNWGLQLVYWFTLGGLGVWAIVDLFRIPNLVSDYNKDIAMDTLRGQKTIG